MDKMRDATYWALFFKKTFAKQISAFCNEVETRLLPTFDSLEFEAKREVVPAIVEG
jgi:hypothetical protein